MRAVEVVAAVRVLEFNVAAAVRMLEFRVLHYENSYEFCYVRALLLW